MNKIKNKKGIILLALLSLMVNSISILSGSLNWVNQFWITGSLFLIAGFLRNAGSFKSIGVSYYIIILLPFLSIYTLYTFMYERINVYPIAIIPYLTFFAGILFSRMKVIKKTVLVLITLSLIIIMGIYSIPNWLAYVSDSVSTENNYDLSTIEFYTSERKLVKLNEIKDKIIVLDFWNTYCSICYKKFPELERLFENYNGEVVVYAVHLIEKGEEWEDVIKKARKLNYNFNFGFTTLLEKEIITKSLNITYVPTLVIINGKGKFIYKGELNTSESVFINNAYSIIDEAIQNR
ncbi:MAG TPA: TlpA disulfide reductase family protein, partial [Bacteroidales bacterium]